MDCGHFHSTGLCHPFETLSHVWSYSITHAESECNLVLDSAALPHFLRTHTPSWPCLRLHLGNTARAAISNVMSHYRMLPKTPPNTKDQTQSETSPIRFKISTDEEGGAIVRRLPTCSGQLVAYLEGGGLRL